MSYEKALKEAGAEIIDFKSFGSYQGDWWAFVNHEGATGFVNGSYGSCSGCDAFKAEFGYDEDKCEEHEYGYSPPSCPDCDTAKVLFEQKIKDFGRGYLEDIITSEEAIKKASENLDWDDNAQEMVDWIKSYS